MSAKSQNPFLIQKSGWVCVCVWKYRQKIRLDRLSSEVSRRRQWWATTTTRRTSTPAACSSFKPERKRPEACFQPPSASTRGSPASSLQWRPCQKYAVRSSSILNLLLSQHLSTERVRSRWIMHGEKDVKWSAWPQVNNKIHSNLAETVKYLTKKLYIL